MRIIIKLFTKEDKFYIHKILGFLSLLNFIYRYIILLPNSNSLYYNNWSNLNFITFIIHFLLSSSSLIFKVLSKRIVNKPLIIYEEYRLHSILFTLRSYEIYLMDQFNIINHNNTIFFIFVCHIIIDLVTYKYGTQGVTSVRNDGKHISGIKYYYKFFYSYYQVLITGCLLAPISDKSNLAFNVIIAIQSSAFLMTLNRKGLVDWKSHAFWYSLALLFSYYYIFLTVNIEIIILTLFAFMLRIYRINKYIIWSAYLLILNFINIDN